MGQLIIERHTGVERVVECAGPLMDILDREFPKGPGGLSSRLSRVSGGPARIIPVDEWEGIEIGEGDTYHLGLTPSGFEIPLWAVVVASVAISVGVTFLLAPKVPGQASQQSANSLYSVGVKANEAKLGAPPPVNYGTVVRTPEYASQSYRVFAGNDEIRHFILCLGAGKYQLDDIFIGDTPTGDLPSGLIEYQVFLPEDHDSELGNIEADFGTHENVVTSGDVDQLELEPVQRYSDAVNGSITGVNIIFNESIADAAISVGDTIVVTSPISATKTIAGVTDTSITVTTSFSGSATDETIEFATKGGDGITRGPFVTNRTGTTTQALEFDIEYPGGLYKQKDNGNFANMTVETTFTLQQIDDAGDDVGSPSTHVFSETGASNNPIRRSYSVTGLTAGRYKVSVVRTDDQEIRARDSARVIWTGMKAYLDYDNSVPRYGNVTLLALKITGAKEISASSQSQIRVRTTSILPEWGADPAAEVAGGNLVDVMADIITNTSYGARQAYSVIHAAAFDAFRTAQAGRSGFNGSFDTRVTVWDALKAVAGLGRAEPVPRGFQVSLVVDEAKPQRASIVTPDNTIVNSLKWEASLTSNTEQDGFEIEYQDALTFERKYAIWPADSVNPKREPPIGLTDPDEALSMAKYLWRQFSGRHRTYTFKTGREGQNLQRYDRIGLAAPWISDKADHGYVTSASGTSVTLNRAAPSGALKLILRDQDGSVSGLLDATGDGGKTIVLAASPPFDLVFDGQSVPTLVTFGAAADFAPLDLTVLEIGTPGATTSIKAVNYLPDLWDDLV
ncbi:host specificity factor TipJ family phage tail protein [Henriciella sp.]|uniref:host specificity factor TipJ family phage tail protein n=1 Tax=Henriciella sp. TaxID=1968823 RepID=UPI000C0FC3A0|nr:host specificity factor TipJ family phage tail protein [Henriciella sp.]PHR83094.1 MAG: hypothetical protein COA64_00115 [Henriciella sp.]